MSLLSHDDATIDAPSGASLTGTVAVTLRPGGRFADRYVVDGVLGRGGMGTVFRVKDELLGGEAVALKVLDQTTPGALERFRREVLLARRITSPHVARTYDLGTHAGTSYLTMELVSGRSLGAVLAEERVLGPARTARIGIAVAAGLRAAHEAGVVHRDLKPDNVLVADDGRVVVTDFGIARALTRADDARLTGGVAGTPHYMAPEQAMGREVDARADLFSLGVLLFECASGRLPFEAESALAALVLRVQGQATEITSVSSTPPGLATLIMQLLAREPDARPASAAVVVERLEAIAASLTQVAPSAISPSSSLPPSTSLGGAPAPAASTPSSSGRERGQLLAVVPFEHRGDPKDRAIADAIRDELVDLVARTRGLSALAKSAAVDASAARSLGATQIVEASVATGSGKLRVMVRLLEPTSGRQLWTERIEGDYTDPFAGPERAAQRIVEALRLALETVAAPSRVPPEAIDAFTQARGRLRGMGIQDPKHVIALLDRSLELAPRFPPALALRAIACVRAWFSPTESLARDWTDDVRSSVSLALAHASHIAETHHAAGLVAWHEGRLRDAASSARAALATAPTYPDAMAFLAQLEIEAGRVEEGLARLAVAHELEPALLIGLFEPARWHGLYGDLPEFERLLPLLERALPDGALVSQFLVRTGAWRGRRDWVERGATMLARQGGPVAAALGIYARIALQGAAADERLPGASFFARTSPRFATLALQLIAEGSMLAARPDEALAAVTRASESVLADLAWIDRCPLLEPIRGTDAFGAARARVFARVQETWL